MARLTLRPGQMVERSGVDQDPVSGERTTLVHGKRAPPSMSGKWVETLAKPVD